MDVAFYEADDIGDAWSSSKSSAGFKDIWDALRVNEPGAPSIGEKNLEISIDEGTSVFSRPINVVYIPMSRMVWTEGDQPR